MRKLAKKAFVLFLLLSTILSLTSCASWLMPYSSNLGCRKDPASGYCGSVSQVYKQSFIDQAKDR
ncbi:MAG: hypothetical protein QXV17_08140 [Candidatus Micrarchaeaceae archaeon]